MRTNCVGCGAPVDMVQELESNKRIAIEIVPESAGPSSRATRYRFVEGSTSVVTRVAPDAVGAFYPDHDYDCPAANAGR